MISRGAALGVMSLDTPAQTCIYACVMLYIRPILSCTKLLCIRQETIKLQQNFILLLFFFTTKLIEYKYFI